MHYLPYLKSKKRDLGDFGSLHRIVGILKKIVINEEAKKHIFKIVKEVPTKLPPEEMYDKKTKEPLTSKDVEKTWRAYYGKDILTKLHQAHSVLSLDETHEKPIDLLKQALKKLEHEKLDIKEITIDDISEAIDTARKIQIKAGDLESDMDKFRYQLKKGLKDHFNGN